MMSLSSHRKAKIPQQQPQQIVEKNLPETPLVFDHRAICDYCDFPIEGRRFKCMNCDNFDLCEFCESSLAGGEGEKPNEKSLSPEAVRAGDKHDPKKHLLMKLNLPVSFKDGLIILPELQEGLFSDDFPHRGIVCDGCSSPVFGVRWKCLQCDDFDFCSECEAKNCNSNYQMHERCHVFVKMYRPLAKRANKQLKLASFYKPQPKFEKYIHTSFSSHDPSSNNNTNNNHNNNNNNNSNNVNCNNTSNVNSNNNTNNNNNNNNSNNVNCNNSNSNTTATRAVKQPIQMQIREMTHEDLEQVYKIEVTSFRAPYELEYFQQLLDSNGVTCLVSEKIPQDEDEMQEDDQILGYICYGIQHRKKKMSIISIAVSPNARGLKIGERLLIQSLLNVHLEQEEIAVNYCSLQVDIFNLPAQNLYKKFGFLPVKWLKNYYSEEKSDALLMEMNFEGFDPFAFLS